MGKKEKTPLEKAAEAILELEKDLTLPGSGIPDETRIQRLIDRIMKEDF
jgi:hypothetical protein